MPVKTRNGVEKEVGNQLFFVSSGAKKQSNSKGKELHLASSELFSW